MNRDEDGSSGARESAADPWGAIAVERWQDVPCLIGRIATEADVQAGRAVYYLDASGDLRAEFVDIGLPHCALWTNEEGEPVPVIIIQSERAGDQHLIGWHGLDGGNGVGLLAEFELLEAPNALFTRGGG